MSKITDKKIISSKSIKCFGKKLLILAIIVAQLVVAACKPKSEAKESEATSTPLTYGQLANNDQEVLETEKPVDSTSTPMDAGFITPEPTKEPVKCDYFLFFPTEEELKALEAEAGNIEERLSNITDGKKDALSRLNYTTYETLRILSGDFSIVDGVKIENETAFNICLNFLNGYVTTIMLCGGKIGDGESKKIKISNAEFSNVFAVAGLDKYTGGETLKLLEDKISELYVLAKKDNESKLYDQKSDEIITLIENVFYKQNASDGDINLTNFYKMHPLIQMVFLEYAVAIDNFISFSVNSENNQELIYRILDLNKTTDKLDDTNYLKNNFINLIVAYKAIVEQGTYDAYMTGDNSQKSAIKELMLADDKMRLY